MIPALLLGLVLSTLYGAAFHLWKNGKLPRLIFYLLLSYAGFWTGHFVAGFLGWNLGRIGSLNVGVATVGSLLFLFVGHWLSLVQVERRA
jgi:hypothetical protein